MFDLFVSKATRRSGAILVALMLPAASYAAASTVEVKVESKSFVSGTRTLQLEDGVPQTVILERPATATFDSRCSIFGLVGPDGSIPTVVTVDVMANRMDDKNVVTRARIHASKAGDVLESVVSASGDRASCPTASSVSTEVTHMVRAGEMRTVFAVRNDKRDIEVVLTVK